MPPFSEMDWSWLCGHRDMVIWDTDTASFSKCFTNLAFVIPAYSLMMVASGYYCGRLAYSRQVPVKFDLIHARLMVSIALFLCPVISSGVAYQMNIKQNNIDYLITIFVSSAWLLHMCFLTLSKTRYLNNTRGPWFIIFCMILILGATVVIMYSLFAEHASSTETPSSDILRVRYTNCIMLVLQVLYILCAIPKCPRRVYSDRLSLVISSDESEQTQSALLDSQFPSYGSFNGVEDSVDLGMAEDAPLLSKMFFFWAAGLMKKGVMQQLASTSELHDLPYNLQARRLLASFLNCGKVSCSATHSPKQRDDSSASSGQQKSTRSRSLLSVLNKCFGVEYFSIGLLKFFSDVLGFCGPILLNYLVDFIETNNKPVSYGYYYTAALFFTTLFGAFCSSHFNYLTTRVGLKIRGTLMSAVYTKTLSVNSTTLSRFSSGKITNFFSTDTDCVVNFCPSFHQFWSLPLQMAVTLYLLHQQLGLAFLAGIGFAIVVIPLNQWIAKKIGALSETLMSQKDNRIKLMNEVLRGIRVIKMHCWEQSFSKKILKLRQAEMEPLKSRKYLDAFCVYFWATTPVLVSLLSFGTYVLLGNKLTAAKVFTSIALFNMLLMPLNAFPWVLNGLMEAWVSLKRLENFLSLPETHMNEYYSEIQDPTNIIEVDNGLFSWSPDPNEKMETLRRSLPNLLSDINVGVNALGPLHFKIREGQFVGIIGSVGSGKSSVISALTADLHLLSGSVAIRTHDFHLGIGLVGQEPWIQHATIRENITFGSPLQTLKYQRVLESCALIEDLKALPFGDRTEVGESGVTLSGGQKARIALARAVYQDFNIYLLDDPFAAVDVHVAEHIFHECIMGLLKYKTRIVITHHTHLLEEADLIIALDNGTVQAIGPPSQFFHEHPSKLQLRPESEKEDRIMDDKKAIDLGSGNRKSLYKDEEREVGSVQFWVYKEYWKAVGGLLSISILISLFCMQASRTLSDWWLAYWTASVRHTANITHSADAAWYSASTNDSDDGNLKFYLGVFGGIAFANTIFTFIRAFLFAYGGIRAAVRIHRRLLASILEGAVIFFDATPLGRIVNRFSTDVYTIDDSLPFTLNILLAQFYSLLGALIITCYGLPWITLLICLLTPIYFGIQEYYRKTSRELKRLCALSLSPVYSFFQETLSGLATIRAFGSVAWFCSESTERLDNNQKAMLSTALVSQWLNLRLQLIGVVIVSSVGLVAVLEHHFDKVDPGLVGLALSYALAITSLLNGMVTYFTETEKEMVSVERAMQYINNVLKEKTHYTVDSPFGWPTHGVISFRNVCLRYHDDAPLALRNICFDTKPSERIGIVGRTGSGKTSLIRAIFRMVEIETGEIFIDGVNIAFISLKSLRSRLSVIPQDPFVFSSSIRENLDPQGNFSDDELWKVLEECYMRSAVVRMGGLDAEVSEGGKEFSVGQRQLLCLARALLIKAKVLCLDEATASIDKETDQLIQATIRRAFSHTTILTIAHRIETIMDSDRVLVMKNGSIVEFDNPVDLLNDSSSILYSMVHQKQEEKLL